MRIIGASAASHVLARSMPTLFVCMSSTNRPVALRMRRNMLSTCCSCARPTNALHSPSNNWGEVNANSVCLFIYICHQPTGRKAHAQKLGKHMFVSAGHRCSYCTCAYSLRSPHKCSPNNMQNQLASVGLVSACSFVCSSVRTCQQQFFFFFFFFLRGA